LLKLIQKFIAPAIRRRQPRRILLVSNEPAEFPGLGELAGHNLIALHSGAAGSSDLLACDSAELPFQDESFEMVVMHNVFTDGSEPEFQEARRILAGGGDLFVLGKGSLGITSRFGKSRTDLPALQVRRMCRQLRNHSFRIEQCVGIGLLGAPVTCEQRWQQPALPFADSVLIIGRHRTLKPIVTPLRFSQPQTVGVQSAAADSLSREAV
jgi:SAM-dependent methyltransferase